MLVNGILSIPLLNHEQHLNQQLILTVITTMILAWYVLAKYLETKSIYLLAIALLALDQVL